MAGKKSKLMKRKIAMVIAAFVAVANLSTVSVAMAADKKVKTVNQGAVIEVEDIVALQPYLKQSNVNVVVKPGTYRVTAADMKAGKFTAASEVDEGKFRSVLFLVEGDNSTYDFTDVTVEIESEVFTNLNPKYTEFINVQTLGNNNVVKNLRLVDIAEFTDAPNIGCTNIMLDGSFNRIEGVQLYSKGSSPYGYGELFGKGGKNVIRHHKHCGCLVRGFKNHVLNCRIIHRAYGHCLFMQAADCPIIEGCYIESVMTTTDKILAEKGTEAEAVGFMTYFGYKIPAGYTIACSEEGIRAYNGGSTMIDGVRYTRGTSNPTILNCYVKNARAGVTLTHATGTKYVEGCTVIGCERGFCIGTGNIVNCKADTQYGPALGVDYERDRGTIADVTLLPNVGEPMSGNGSKHAAIIIGNNHKITLRRGDGFKEFEEDLLINIGGDNRTIGLLNKDQNYNANNIEIINETGYTIVLDDNTSNITGTTKGKVEDHGENNNLKEIK